MTKVPTRQVEFLINLVELRLMELSAKGEETTPDYRELQECRSTLLEALLSPPTAHSANAGADDATHLQLIEGGLS